MGPVLSKEAVFSVPERPLARKAIPERKALFSGCGFGEPHHFCLVVPLPGKVGNDGDTPLFFPAGCGSIEENITIPAMKEARSHLTQKRILSLFVALMMIFSLCGCQGNPVSEQTESERFEEYLDDSFRESLSSSLFDLHFFLIHPENYGIDVQEVPANLGSIDLEELDNSQENFEEEYEELTSFDRSQLTESQQITYDILLWTMETDRQSLGLEYYQELCSPLLGIQSQLPSLLGEYAFREEQDVEDYLAILATVDDYFQDVLDFQRKKSELGLFMSDETLDQMLTNCQAFVEQPEENYLITGFEEHLEELPQLTEEQREDYIQRNRQVVLEEVIPAYTMLMEGMEALRGTGVNDGGLAGFEQGKDYYAYLVADSTGSEKTVEEIIEMIDQRLEEAMRELVLTVYQSPESLEDFENFSFPLTDPQEVMEDLKAKSAEDFPPLEELSYEINYVHSSMEDSSSPAFYLTPPVDADGANANVIYINRSTLSGLYNTMAHEGYPGHMYQRNYFLTTGAHPLRCILSFSGYTEGWATYVESLSYQMAGLQDGALIKLLQLNDEISLAISARADLGVNYEGWDRQTLGQFLAVYGFSDQEVTDGVFQAVVQDPANYLSYYVGMLEFRQLRQKAEEALGEDFEAMEFHRAVLDVGPAPFSIVEQAVDSYLAKAQQPAA